LAVRGSGTRSPDCEVRGGVAIPVYDEAAPVAAEDPLGKRQALVDHLATGAGPGRGEPAITDYQLATEPVGFIAELAGKLRPAGVSDGPGKVLALDEVRNSEVLYGKPAVGLGELA
jgi:hypothetical protein